MAQLADQCEVAVYVHVTFVTVACQKPVQLNSVHGSRKHLKYHHGNILCDCNGQKVNMFVLLEWDFSWQIEFTIRAFENAEADT